MDFYEYTHLNNRDKPSDGEKRNRWPEDPGYASFMKSYHFGMLYGAPPNGRIYIADPEAAYDRVSNSPYENIDEEYVWGHPLSYLNWHEQARLLLLRGKLQERLIEWQ